MRLTRWEGHDEDGPRAVLVKRDGSFAPILQEALRKLALYEDMEEGFYDKEKIYTNCTVQVLMNSNTGACSIGWWPNENEQEM